MIAPCHSLGPNVQTVHRPLHASGLPCRTVPVHIGRIAPFAHPDAL
jgi:hypothetical protein